MYLSLGENLLSAGQSLQSLFPKNLEDGTSGFKARNNFFENHMHSGLRSGNGGIFQSRDSLRPPFEEGQISRYAFDTKGITSSVPTLRRMQLDTYSDGFPKNRLPLEETPIQRLELKYKEDKDLLNQMLNESLIAGNANQAQVLEHRLNQLEAAYDYEMSKINPSYLMIKELRALRNIFAPPPERPPLGDPPLPIERKAEREAEREDDWGGGGEDEWEFNPPTPKQKPKQSPKQSPKDEDEKDPELQPDGTKSPNDNVLDQAVVPFKGDIDGYFNRNVIDSYGGIENVPKQLLDLGRPIQSLQELEAGDLKDLIDFIKGSIKLQIDSITDKNKDEDTVLRETEKIQNELKNIIETLDDTEELNDDTIDFETKDGLITYYNNEIKKNKDLAGYDIANIDGVVLTKTYQKYTALALAAQNEINKMADSNTEMKDDTTPNRIERVRQMTTIIDNANKKRENISELMKNKGSKDVGELLREFKLNAGLSPEQQAERAGIEVDFTKLPDTFQSKQPVTPIKTVNLDDEDKEDDKEEDLQQQITAIIMSDKKVFKSDDTFDPDNLEPEILSITEKFIENSRRSPYLKDNFAKNKDLREIDDYMNHIFKVLPLIKDRYEQKIKGTPLENALIVNLANLYKMEPDNVKKDKITAKFINSRSKPVKAVLNQIFKDMGLPEIKTAKKSPSGVNMKGSDIKINFSSALLSQANTSPSGSPDSVSPN